MHKKTTSTLACNQLCISQIALSDFEVKSAIQERSILSIYKNGHIVAVNKNSEQYGMILEWKTNGDGIFLRNLKHCGAVIQNCSTTDECTLHIRADGRRETTVFVKIMHEQFPREILCRSILNGSGDDSSTKRTMQLQSKCSRPFL